uniref:Subtilisin n=1 Tax=Coccolithus braarudii TaxID=221442 RepID=A0A7S0LKR5_9EUKA
MRSLSLLLACLNYATATGSGENGSHLSATASAAGDALGQCGAASKELGANDRVQVCIGFEPADRRQAGGSGSKAVFYPRVDQYSNFAIDALEPVVASADWTVAQQYSYMWLGVAGQRTVGQERGVINDAGDCIQSDSGEGRVCYGWALHNKPLVNRDKMLVSSITAIVHLERGEVTRVVWDNGCSLCPERNNDALSCLQDNTTIVCSSDGDGACSDCFVRASADSCASAQGRCTPTVYVAWVGTDKHGVPMTSAGKIFSRFGAYSLGPVYDSLYKEVTDIADVR